MKEVSAFCSHNRAANTLEAGRVSRYHAVPTVAPQTVGLHAYGVAVLCLYITGGEASAALLRQALLHDAAELVTGDIPFTVKRDRPEVKALFNELEELAHERWVFPASELSTREAAILKLCDTIEGLIWCRKTELTGPVRHRWVEALNKALGKFEGLLTDDEFSRAVHLVNNENFYPTV